MLNRPQYTARGKSASRRVKPEGFFYAVVTRVFTSTKASHYADAILGSNAGSVTTHTDALIGSVDENTVKPSVYVRVPRLASTFEFGPVSYVGEAPEVGDRVWATFKEGRQDDIVIVTGKGGGGGSSSGGIGNDPGEIAAFPEKTTLVANDEFLIEDSADSYNKKSAKISAIDVGILGDVDVTGILNGQVLKWNSTSGAFEPSDDDTGSGTVPDGNATNDGLVWNGSQWVARETVLPNITNVQTGDLIEYSGTEWVNVSETDAIARVTIRKDSGADTGSRRRLNFLEGSGITITATDVPGSEEVTIQITSTVAQGDVSLEDIFMFGGM